jgi:hypothetical protein
MYIVSSLVKKIFSKNRKQLYEYKLSNKTNLNINKYKNINTSIKRDQSSKISNEEIGPVDLNINISFDYFCSEAIQEIINRNALVKLFVKKMEDLAYSPGINGEMFGILYNTTQINDSAVNILNCLESKCAIISEVFFMCAAAMATDQTFNLSSVYGMIDPLIFSYENVISSHFQLLDA